MSRSSRSQIADRLAKEFGSRDKARDAVDKVLDAILREAHGSEFLLLTGFGTFTRKKIKARYARNPQTGERVWVPESWTLKYSPGAAVVDLMNQDNLPDDRNVAKKADKYTYTPKPDPKPARDKDDFFA